MANFNFNKVILGGRLVETPELKQTPSGLAVTTFRIAVGRKYTKGQEQTADFFSVTAWRTTAEFICKYFSKGASICLVGSVQNRQYEKDGEKRTFTEIIADEASFVDAKQDAGGGVYMPEALRKLAAPPAPPAPAQQMQMPADQLRRSNKPPAPPRPPYNDDDLPF